MKVLRYPSLSTVGAVTTFINITWRSYLNVMYVIRSKPRGHPVRFAEFRAEFLAEFWVEFIAYRPCAYSLKRRVII